MADFRRWFTVLAVLALFAGLASAQVSASGGTGNMTCTTGTGAVTPQIRAEGFTELVGDIVINCTGGDVTAPSSTQALRTANIVVSFGALAVTSRILSTSGGQNLSEALLLVDEPNSNIGGIVPNFGSLAGLKFCPTPTTGCAAYPTVVTSPVGNTVVSTGIPYTSTPASPVLNNGTVVNSANVFQGISAGNQVTFFGVPILPPATSGYARVFRITNVRVNAAGFSAGAQVIASISTNGSTSLPIQNPTLTVGFVTKGLDTAVTTKNSPYQQCNSVPVSSSVLASNSLASVLTFKELFGTAFKTRSAGTSGAYTTTTIPPQAGGAAAGAQNVPGNITYSESGFVFADAGLSVGSGIQAGLADYGTRLKAVFSNIPAGVTVYVSAIPVTSAGAKRADDPGAAAIASNSAVSWAVLVTGEAAGDGTGLSNTFPAAAQGSIKDVNNVPAVALTAGSTGQATAVWEITNTIPNSLENLYFNVYVSYTSSPGTNIPAAPATGVVNMSFAPTPTAAFTAAAGAQASSTLSIPRFSDTSTAATFMTTTICQTALLWPYIVNGLGTGLDTGLAIANTSKDPFGTTAQAGICTISFYGNATVADYPIASVAGGTVWANNLQNIPGARNFAGYAIAVCNFQYAHGYAAITDLSLSNFVSSYLALILNPPTSLPVRSSVLGPGEVLSN